MAKGAALTRASEPHNRGWSAKNCSFFSALSVFSTLSLSFSVESTRETSDESSIRQRRALFRPPGPLSKEVKRYARWNKEGKREREREIECFEVERYGKFYRFAIAFHHFRGSTFVRCDRDDEGRDRDARESPAT